MTPEAPSTTPNCRRFSSSPFPASARRSRRTGRPWQRHRNIHRTGGPASSRNRRAAGRSGGPAYSRSRNTIRTHLGRRWRGSVRQPGRSSPARAVAANGEYLNHFQRHIAFKLIEEFLMRIDVIIVPRNRAGQNHHDKILIAPDRLAQHRRLEQVPVIVDPAFQIEGGEVVHHGNPPPLSPPP